MLSIRVSPNMALQRTRRPRFRSGRSLRSLGSPLMRRPLGRCRLAPWRSLVAVACIAVACFSGEPAIKAVEVRNSQRELVKTLSGLEVNRFRELWARKRVTAVNEPPGAYGYKLNIAFEATYESWLYDPRGFATVLSVKEQRAYAIDDVREFNALIGISGT